MIIILSNKLRFIAVSITIFLLGLSIVSVSSTYSYSDNNNTGFSPSSLTNALENELDKALIFSSLNYQNSDINTSLLFSSLLFSSDVDSSLLFSSLLFSSQIDLSLLFSSLLFSSEFDESLLFSSEDINSSLLFSSLLFSSGIDESLLFSSGLNSNLLFSSLLFSSDVSSDLLFSSTIYSSLLFSSLLFSSDVESSLLFSSLLFSSLLFSSLLFSSGIDASLLFSSLLFSSDLDVSLLFSSLLFSSTLLNNLLFSSIIDNADFTFDLLFSSELFTMLLFSSLLFSSLLFSSYLIKAHINPVLLFSSLLFSSDMDLDLIFSSLLFSSEIDLDLLFSSNKLKKRINKAALKFKKDLKHNKLAKYLPFISWSDFNPETSWGVDRVFNGEYKGNSEFSSRVQIAILDTGIDGNHPELQGKISWSVDATGQNNPVDEVGHGTAVAGIIGAEFNGYGVAGVATNAEIYSVKVLAGEDSIGEWEWLANGIYLAVQGPDGIVGTSDDAEIISMSLDSNGEVPPALVYDAVKWAYDLGVILVSAAGNDGDGSFKTNEISWPAAYPEVIAVGSSNIFDKYSDFSNTARFITFVAPGEYISTTFLDNQYLVGSGTSLSVPFISGIISHFLANGGQSSDVFDFLNSHSMKMSKGIKLIQY